MPAIAFSRLTQNTFILSTTILAASGWLIAFGGACALRVLHGAWWVVIYEALIVLLCMIVSMSGTMQQYRLVVLTFLATSIPLLTIQIDYVLQYTKASIPHDPANAYAAGYIILVITQMLWVCVFGSEQDSFLGRLGYLPGSCQAHDFAQTNPATGQPMTDEKQKQEIQSHFQDKRLMAPRSPTSDTPFIGSVTPTPQPQPNLSHQESVPSTLEYREKVEALHAYRANPEDPNELSFEKGEILEIVDRKGNWWQARKMDGTVGIIPSNYFTKA